MTKKGLISPQNRKKRDNIKAKGKDGGFIPCLFRAASEPGSTRKLQDRARFIYPVY
jgi:hypothetical protein